MSRNSSGLLIGMDALESRTLLHGIVPIHPIDPSPTIQADLDAITAAQTQLSTDTKSLRGTLKADRSAIRDAIDALAPTLDPLKTTLKNDSKTWRATLRADEKAVRAARGDDDALAAARTQLKNDRASAKTALKADADAIQTAIDNDPTVSADKAKLKTDSQPITDDLATLKAAYQKLRDDLKAEHPTTNAGGTTSNT